MYDERKLAISGPHIEVLLDSPVGEAFTSARPRPISRSAGLKGMGSWDMGEVRNQETWVTPGGEERENQRRSSRGKRQSVRATRISYDEQEVQTFPLSLSDTTPS